MVDKFFRWRRVLAHVLSSPAGPYLDNLATTFVRAGFGRWEVRRRVHGAAHFSVFGATVCVAIDGLHEDLLPAFRAHLRTCRCPAWLRHGRHADVCAMAGARALVDHLRHLAIVRSPAPVRDTTRRAAFGARLPHVDARAARAAGRDRAQLRARDR